MYITGCDYTIRLINITIIYPFRDLLNQLHCKMQGTLSATVCGISLKKKRIRRIYRFKFKGHLYSRKIVSRILIYMYVIGHMKNQIYNKPEMI